MKQVAVIIVLLVIAAAAYLVFTFSPRQVTPKDIHPVPGLVRTSQQSTAQENTPDTVAVNQPVAETGGSAVPGKQPEKAVPEQIKPEMAKPVPQASAPPVSDDGNYYIIIESFKNREAASQRASYLEKKYNTEIFILPPTPAGICRLSYGRYPTYEKADSALIKVRIKLRPEAWILSPAR